MVRSRQTSTYCACAGGRGAEADLRHVSVSERPTTDIRETCTYCHTSPPPQAGGTSLRRRCRLDADLCDIPATDRDSAVQKRSFGDNRRALSSPYETAQSTCSHSPVLAGDDATDQELLEVVQVGIGPHRLAICSVWFTCLHARVRHPCPAQHHWRGRPLQRLHIQPQRRQQLGQVSEREQPLGRH